MKKYYSAFLLLARSSLYRLLALWALLAGVQTVFFRRAVLVLLEQGTSALEGAVDGVLPLAFAVGAFGTLVLLSLTGCELGSRSGYTIRRLPLSEKAFFLCQSLYHALALLALWGVELGISFALGQLYLTMADPALLTSQTIPLAYLRSDFLSALLPLSDPFQWLNLLLLLPSLGIISAAVPFYQRRTGSFLSFLSPLFFACLVAGWSFQSNSHLRLFFSLALLSAALIAVISIFTREEAETA